MERVVGQSLLLKHVTHEPVILSEPPGRHGSLGGQRLQGAVSRASPGPAG